MPKNEKVYKFEISHRTIIFTVFLILSLRFLLIIKDLLFSLFIAFIITSALRPILDRLVRLKIPRVLAALLVYFSFLTIFVGLLSIIFPPLIKETVQLSRNFPSIIERLTAGFSGLPYSFFNWQSLFQYIPTASNQIFNLITRFFSNTIWFFYTLFFSFYFLVEEDAIKKILANFLAEEKTERIIDFINLLEKRINNWFWGQVFLMVIVGTLTYIGLNLIGIKYALPLAVLAGLLEIVPNLGPTLAAIPAILIGFSQSPFLGISALALAILVQQLENNLIVPLIMKKAVGLNPIITLMALIIGGKLAGVFGVLLSVPVVVLLKTFFLDFLNKK